jgi:hypothetical protein
MDKDAILPSSGPYQCQQLYDSHLLCFKIITLTIPTDILRDLIQEVGRVPRPQTARNKEQPHP